MVAPLLLHQTGKILLCVLVSMMTPVERVASGYMLKEAKRKHLKAIDFTIGLVRRLSAAGARLPGVNNDAVIKRLIEMRRASQVKGFDMASMLENKALLSGKGKTILKLLEKTEAKVLPDDQDLAGFIKDFGNRSPAAQDAQAKKFAETIARSTGEDSAAVERRVTVDEDFFNDGFTAVMPLLKKALSAADSTIGSGAGAYASRIKEPKSSFGKQGREGMSFLRFKDLVGCRIVSPTIREMAKVAVVTQGKFDILQKKNYYLKNVGYNAINYVFGAGAVVCEFQLKTSANDIEAALSHDLIYAEEKAIIKLPQAEKDMVSRVIDVSTQLSMRDWAKAFDVAMRLASMSDRVAFLTAASR